MARHRDLATSPVRSTAETWQAITELIAVSVGRSSSIAENDVRLVLHTARAAGHALVAGGHLDRDVLTVIAGPLYLTVSTVSGHGAFSALEAENTNPVPGAATATTWMAYLPAPGGLATLVEELCSESEHLSSGVPPKETVTASSSASIDLRRLDPAQRNSW